MTAHKYTSLCWASTKQEPVPWTAETHMEKTAVGGGKEERPCPRPAAPPSPRTGQWGTGPAGTRERGHRAVTPQGYHRMAASLLLRRRGQPGGDPASRGSQPPLAPALLRAPSSPERVQNTLAAARPGSNSPPGIPVLRKSCLQHHVTSHFNRQ